MYRHIFSFLMLILLTACAQQTIKPRARSIKPKDVQAFHRDIVLRVGWFPYEEDKLIRVGANQWKMVDGDSTMGVIPVILVSHPDSADALWLDMDIENELLGRLVKHSLMTQIPIRKPFREFLVEADCSTCHPASIPLNPKIE